MLLFNPFQIGSLVYMILFFIAFVPPLFHLPPFTNLITKKKYPKIIHTSDQFIKINLILNYFWSVIFALCFVLTSWHYSDAIVIQAWLQHGLPALFQLGFALPITLFLYKFFYGK